jgi:hypothetical protein
LINPSAGTVKTFNFPAPSPSFLPDGDAVIGLDWAGGAQGILDVSGTSVAVLNPVTGAVKTLNTANNFLTDTPFQPLSLADDAGSIGRDGDF